MRKLHVIGGFHVLLAAVACHPIGPPDGSGYAHRPAPGAPPAMPAAANPPAAAATASGPDSSTTASAPANPRPKKSSAASASTAQAGKPSATADSPPTAQKAPGRPGYVLSPHTGKLMLVDGIPSGVVVPDQTCPPGEKKFFRVP